MSVCIAVILGVVRTFVDALAFTTNPRWREESRCADTDLQIFSAYLTGFINAIVARIEVNHWQRWYLSASPAIASEAVFTCTCKAAKLVSADAMLRITIVQWFSIRVSSDTLVKADTTQETMTFLGEL